MQKLKKGYNSVTSLTKKNKQHRSAFLLIVLYVEFHIPISRAQPRALGEGEICWISGRVLDHILEFSVFYIHLNFSLSLK